MQEKQDILKTLSLSNNKNMIMPSNTGESNLISTKSDDFDES